MCFVKIVPLINNNDKRIYIKIKYLYLHKILSISYFVL